MSDTYWLLLAIGVVPSEYMRWKIEPKLKAKYPNRYLRYGIIGAIWIVDCFVTLLILWWIMDGEWEL